MEIYIQYATPQLRREHNMTATDSPIVVLVNGYVVAWVDDYSTVHIVRKDYEPAEQEIKELVFQAFEIYTALDSGSIAQPPPERGSCDRCGQPFDEHDQITHRSCA